jgi:hypothetical protein
MKIMKLLSENWQGLKLLNESGLSWVFKHIQDHDCVIITTLRDNTEDERNCTEKADLSVDNKENNRALKATLLGLGYGVIKVNGSYSEDSDIETAKEFKEDSLFCVNLEDDPGFTDTLAELGEKFCQDSIVVFPKGGKCVYLRGTNSASFPGYSNEQVAGGLVAGQLAESMTRVKGFPFTVKEILELETYDKLSRLQKMSVRAAQKKVLGG